MDSSVTANVIWNPLTPKFLTINWISIISRCSYDFLVDTNDKWHLITSQRGALLWATLEGRREGERGQTTRNTPSHSVSWRCRSAAGRLLPYHHNELFSRFAEWMLIHWGNKVKYKWGPELPRKKLKWNLRGEFARNISILPVICP